MDLPMRTTGDMRMKLKVYIVWDDDRWPEAIFFNKRYADNFADAHYGTFVTEFETEDEPVKVDPYYAE